MKTKTRMMGLVILAVLIVVLVLTSVKTTVRGTVSESASPVKYAQIGWKPGLRTFGGDPWETGRFTARGGELWNGPPPETVTADATGAYELVGIASGDLTIFFSPDGKRWYAQEVLNLWYGEKRTLDVDISRLEDIAEPRQVLGLEHRFEGNKLILEVKGLTPEEKSPYADVRAAKPRKVVRQEVAGPDGKIVIDLGGLEPGDYAVGVVAERTDVGLAPRDVRAVSRVLIVSDKEPPRLVDDPERFERVMELHLR